jgi:hypothetical protein
MRIWLRVAVSPLLYAKQDARSCVTTRAHGDTRAGDWVVSC